MMNSDISLVSGSYGEFVSPYSQKFRQYIDGFGCGLLLARDCDKKERLSISKCLEDALCLSPDRLSKPVALVVGYG